MESLKIIDIVRVGSKAVGMEGDIIETGQDVLIVEPVEYFKKNHCLLITKLYEQKHQVQFSKTLENLLLKLVEIQQLLFEKSCQSIKAWCKSC